MKICQKKYFNNSQAFNNAWLLLTLDNFCRTCYCMWQVTSSRNTHRKLSLASTPHHILIPFYSSHHFFWPKKFWCNLWKTLKREPWSIAGVLACLSTDFTLHVHNLAVKGLKILSHMSKYQIETKVKTVRDIPQVPYSGRAVLTTSKHPFTILVESNSSHILWYTIIINNLG